MNVLSGCSTPNSPASGGDGESVFAGHAESSCSSSGRNDDSSPQHKHAHGHHPRREQERDDARRRLLRATPGASVVTVSDTGDIITRPLDTVEPQPVGHDWPTTQELALTIVIGASRRRSE
jgi:hypothetical protein